MGEVGVVFLSGGCALAPRRKLETGIANLELAPLSHLFFLFFERKPKKKISLAPTSIHPNEKPPPQPPPLGPPPWWPHSGCVKMGGHLFHHWSLFWICAFLPLFGSCEGKTQKRQVAGENKNKWRQLSPHSPLHPNHLHPPPHFSHTYLDPSPSSP